VLGAPVVPVPRPVLVLMASHRRYQVRCVQAAVSFPSRVDLPAQLSSEGNRLILPRFAVIATLGRAAGTVKMRQLLAIYLGEGIEAELPQGGLKLDYLPPNAATRSLFISFASFLRASIPWRMRSEALCESAANPSGSSSRVIAAHDHFEGFSLLNCNPRNQVSLFVLFFGAPRLF